MLGLLLGLVVAAALVACLTFAAVKQWFNKNTIVDEDNVRAVLQEELANKNYKVVKIGFNRKSQKITAIDADEAKDRDQELKDLGPEAIIHEEC